LIKTGNLTTNEAIDLSPEMAIINNSDTPFTSLLLNMNLTDTITSDKPIWREKSLDLSSGIQQLEGFQVSTGSFYASTREEKTNYCTLFSKGASVAGTIQASTITGIPDMFASEITDRLSEVKFQLESGLINSTLTTGTVATAQTMAGLLSWCVTGNIVSPATGLTATSGLSLETFKNTVKKLWTNAAGSEFVCLANADLKDVVDSIYTSTYFYNAPMAAFGLVVRRIETSYGAVNIILNRYVPATKLIVFNPQYTKLAFLRKPQFVSLAKTGDSTNGLVLCQATLKVLNHNAIAIYGT
jgi:hypothetical protein